jgi:SAM-dependent methyltransferase
VESSSLRFSKEKEQKITNLYTRVLPVGARILDLMASIDSHLADDLQTVFFVGLGMNREELNANPRLSESLVHDLNPDPGLPFADASFNAAVCSVSVEYLTDPLAEFAEVWRALKPGEVFINSFSSRWFPPKAINLWIDLHEFERMVLVGGVLSAHRGFRDPVHLVPAGAATSA